MRELKDYFCTYEQTMALKKLGYLSEAPALAFHASFYETQTPDLKFEYDEEFDNFDIFERTPLRSQALDYFRELGYSAGLRGTTPYNWYLIDIPDKKIMSIKSGNYVSHVHCESALIDKLIELEKEARNE